MSAETIAKALGGRRSGAEFLAHCPCHDDEHASLSLRDAPSGKVLVKCRAGCSQDAVLSALRARDLLPSHTPRTPRLERKREVGRQEWQFKYAGGVATHVRIDYSDGSKSMFWTPRGVKPAELLYEPLKDINNFDVALIVEGEKAADAAAAWAVAAVFASVCGAASTPADAKLRPIAAQYRRIMLWPDNDPPGHRHMDKVGARLLALGAKEIRVVDWPDAPPGGDAADFEGGAEAAQALLNAAKPFEPNCADAKDDAASKRKSPPQKEVLIAIGRRAELFHDSDTCYATVEVDGHQETYSIAGSGFRNWLLQEYFEERGDAPDDQALREARAMLSALARFKGDERRVHVRLAHHADRIYLDLGNANWQVAEISASGWRVLEARDTPVRFRRVQGMLPLPIPEPGGCINDLRSFLNCASDEAFILDVAWLVGCFSRGPYPILIQQAEEGSAKSTSSRVLRDLIDPNEVPLRSPPREEGDILIAAQHGWVIAYDNLSYIADWLSDSLCRLATGGGLSKRKLYTDADEVLLTAKRPALLTSIEELPSRGDLLSRAIIQARPFIPESRRKPEQEFWEEFEAARPKLLGALLTAVAGALADLDSVRLPGLPRMADFTKWVTAAEPALGWEPGTFLNIYAGNRAAAIDVALEASPVALLVRDKLTLPFEGTASELLAALNQVADEDTRRARDWPKTGRGMRSRLERITSPLRHIGIEVQFGNRESNKNRDRRLTITRSPLNMGKQSSESSETSDNPKNLGKSSAFHPLASDGRSDGRTVVGRLPDGCATVADDRESAKKSNDFKELGPASDGSDGSDGSSPAFGGSDIDPADDDIEPCVHGEDPLECRECADAREDVDDDWEEIE